MSRYRARPVKTGWTRAPRGHNRRPGRPLEGRRESLGVPTLTHNLTTPRST